MQQDMNRLVITNEGWFKNRRGLVNKFGPIVAVPLAMLFFTSHP